MEKIWDNFNDKLNQYAKEVEEELDRLLPTDMDEEYSIVVQAMRYSLLGGGKRLRAALLLEVCNACCGSYTHALPFACAVEMIHAYSLIHDDLPCMDNDDMRRGKPSCHMVFGVPNALLAGDGLLTKAFGVIMGSQAPPEAKVWAAGCLADCAGEQGMIGGQVLDLENERLTPAAGRLERTYLLKTGRLLEASAKMGAILGGADQTFIDHVGKYALYTGLAFQIFDDILDIAGDEDKVGKPIGSDLQNHKTTYVTLYPLEQAMEIAQEKVRQAKSELACMNIQSEWLSLFADRMICRDS